MIPKIPVDISIPEPVLGLISIIALLLAVLFIYLAISHMKQLKPGRSGLYSLLSILSLSGAALVLLTTLNIYSYQRLSYEAEIAEIHFSRVGTQLYAVDLHIDGSGLKQQFELHGDEWQMDARVIKWKVPLTLVGFNSLYRLERLQGRYRDINLERQAARSVFALNKDSRFDLWSIIRQYKKYLPWIDAFYGSATYLPMADKASFQIKITQSGLIARPVNEAARQALGNWN